MTESPVPPIEASSPSPSLSVGQRVVAIFTRPSQAWGGLETRVLWWVPLLIFTLVSVAGSVALYDRAVLPMMRDQFDDKVASGEMSAEQAARTEEAMAGPIGRTFGTVPSVLIPAFATLLTAFGVSFTVGFLLGGKLRFRLGMEVAAWSTLVAIPGQLIAYTLAWTRETFKDLHIGLGAFIPEPDTPNKLITGLKVFLDALGPFSIWGLVVMILGASALSGLPSRRVGWALSIMYLVLWLLFAGLAAVFAPAA